MTATEPKPIAIPVLIRRELAAATVGMGLSTFDRHAASGLLPAPARVGGVKLWCAAELTAWAAHGCPTRDVWADLWPSIRAAQLLSR